jgi:predicted dehydrogenase
LDQVPHASDARAYGSHEDLLADPTVDAVYLALPHDLHCQWAIAAMRAGKSVLCEKPATLTAAQMQDIARVSQQTGTCFMEAMKLRFVAIYQSVLEAIARLGTIRYVEATLCNDMLGFVEGSGTYHMTPGPGAGVLLDCGTYCASWIEDFCPGVPTLVSIAGATKDGIDTYADARLSHGGIDARLECAFDRAKPRTATIVGTKGSIRVDELHRPQHAVLTLADGTVEEFDTPYVVDDFFGEVRHMTDLVEQGTTESPAMSLDASVRCARILDAVRANLPA